MIMTVASRRREMWTGKTERREPPNSPPGRKTQKADRGHLQHRTQNTESRQAPKQGPSSTNAAKCLDQKDTESRHYVKALSHIFAAQMKRRKSPSFAFLDAIASPIIYPRQSVGHWVSFRFGDSYRISELCELVLILLIRPCELN